MARIGDNLYKRKDGRWEGRYIRDRRPDGKIIYGYIYHRKYQEAKKLLFENRLAYRKYYQTFGKHHASGQMVNEWFNYWLDQKRAQVKQTTYQSYESKMINHIIPYFQDTQLNKLTGEIIQQWLLKLSKRISANSVHAVFRVFKQGIKAALDKELLYKSPLKEVILPKQMKSDVRSFSRKEQECIERFCQTTKELPIVMALDTGMRISEILGLTWRNIDWDNQTISIEHIVQRVKQGDKTQLIFTTPKTSASIRVIPLTKRLIRLLKKQKRESKSQFIFEGNRGMPIDPRSVRYRFEKVKKNSDVGDLPFHALRHTFATRCLESGINITTVSALLGHSSVKLTLDIYTNSFLCEKRKAIEQLESSY
ncbi:tyrosine-type recombinase/integrase [Enterococcus sp. DIV0756]|uniref:tyrosine-type recombinase/integrase n=1 Tax=Enterococcus sp. DIV0756 TaxID=2774636 RepID=UPI003F210178